MDEGKYRIRVAAEMTGTTAPQLRVWEKRYGVPQPRRSSSRYRLYSERDLAELKRMRELVQSGLPPSEAARRVKESRTEVAAQASKPISMVGSAAKRVKTLMLEAIDARLRCAEEGGGNLAPLRAVLARMRSSLGPLGPETRRCEQALRDEEAVLAACAGERGVM